MAENDFPKDISKPERIDPTKSLQPGEEAPQKGGTQQPFSAYMKEGPSQTAAGQPSPMDIAAGQVSPASQPTLDSVHAQMKSVSGSLGDVHDQLQTKNLKLKRSQNYLLRNKLTDANANLRTAHQKLGGNPGEMPKMSGKQNPLTRFVGLVSDSQTQMKNAQGLIQKMSEQGQEISPGMLLTVQVKINKASQQLEYCSVLLSNAVSALKSMFNVQI